MKKFFILSVFISNISFAQDSISIADIQSAEKIISLHFTVAKEDSLLERRRRKKRKNMIKCMGIH